MRIVKNPEPEEDDELTCRRCGAMCLLRPGDDYTPFCDHCAHEVVEQQGARIATLEAALREARGKAAALQELPPNGAWSPDECEAFAAVLDVLDAALAQPVGGKS